MGNKKDDAARRSARAKKAGRKRLERDAAQREARAEQHLKLINERIEAGFPELDAELWAATMAEQHDAFIAKFGREPGPGEPVFFDPDADQPIPITREKDNAEFRRIIVAAGVDEAYADASEELGYVVTEMNQHHFSLAELDAWDEAVTRFRRIRRDGGAEDRP